MRTDSLESHRVLRVGGTPFTVRCIRCAKSTRTDREPIYADLDGKPWVDYYCEPCALERGAKIDGLHGATPYE